MFSIILCIMTIVGLANSSEWIGYPPEKPKELAHKEGCYVREINDVIPYGEEVAPTGYCYKVICLPRIMQYYSCGVTEGSGSGCYTTQLDISKPYPSCCPHIECKDEKLV